MRKVTNELQIHKPSETISTIMEYHVLRMIGGGLLGIDMGPSLSSSLSPTSTSSSSSSPSAGLTIKESIPDHSIPSNKLGEATQGGSEKDDDEREKTFFTGNTLTTGATASNLLGFLLAREHQVRHVMALRTRGELFFPLNPNLSL